MTAATHMCVLCMRNCNGITAYILLHYLLKFHLEITKAKEMTTVLYVLSDHPSYFILMIQSCGHICTIRYMYLNIKFYPFYL